MNPLNDKIRIVRVTINSVPVVRFAVCTELGIIECKSYREAQVVAREIK